jgi:nitric oxide reductase subunit B
MQRVIGDYYMDVQDSIAIFYWMRLGAGVVVFLGVLLFLYAIFVPRKELISSDATVAAE